jgi:hypothetical protein
MITKTKLIVGFIIMISIWAASYIIHLYETKDSFKIENISHGQIDTIKISEGIEKTVIISNQDSILRFMNILLQSKMAEDREVKLRATRSFEITIHFKNNKSTDLDLLKTVYSGDILRSGDYYYQSSPLLNFIVNMFDK